MNSSRVWEGECSGPKAHSFVYLILAALGLCYCTWTFSSCRERGLFPSWGTRASHCSGFSFCRTWVLGPVDSVGAVSRLSYPEASGIFPIKPVSPALPGRILTTGSSGKFKPSPFGVRRSGVGSKRRRRSRRRRKGWERRWGRREEKRRKRGRGEEEDMK